MDFRRRADAEIKYAREPLGFKSVIGVLGEARAVQIEEAAAIVADKEHGASTLSGRVVLDRCSTEIESKGVAVVVDGTPASTSRRARLGRVGSVADRSVVAEQRVDHGEAHIDAAESATIRTGVARCGTSAKHAVDHIDGASVVLTENPYGRSAHIRSGAGADVVFKLGVDDFKSAASHPDGAASIVGKIV